MINFIPGAAQAQMFQGALGWFCFPPEAETALTCNMKCLSWNWQVEQRHYLVSKAVEEVQKIIQQLTTEISSKATRFQAISNSGIHNENIKVWTRTLMYSLAACRQSVSDFSVAQVFVRTGTSPKTPQTTCWHFTVEILVTDWVIGTYSWTSYN